MANSSDALQSAAGQERKALTWDQAITAACALFELNVNERELEEIAERATLPYGDGYPEETARLRREWMGFVHAGIIYAMMDRASSRSVEGYIACTRQLLEHFAGYDSRTTESFIDTTLSSYVGLLLNRQQRQCPQMLLEAVLGKDYASKLSADQIAFIAGMMAITLCNILDTLERHDFLPVSEGEE